MSPQRMVDFPAPIMDEIKPGVKLRIFYQKGNRNNRLLHVRAVVDGWYVVCRQWVPGKNFWRYTLEDGIFLQLTATDGHLTVEPGRDEEDPDGPDHD